jgi:hypothetical protein
MTVQHMHIACWILSATANTLSGYVILIVFPLQQWLHTRAPQFYITHTLPVLYCVNLILIVNKIKAVKNTSLLFFFVFPWFYTFLNFTICSEVYVMMWNRGFTVIGLDLYPTIHYWWFIWECLTNKTLSFHIIGTKNEIYIPGGFRVCVIVLSQYRKIPELYCVVTVWWYTETQWRGIEGETGEWSV